nr:retrovirus-related Pol polyprotein from transposon TNT 1-94 [Tanacetum cinerariifolium]
MAASKNKGLVAETFNCDEEEVFDDEEMTEVKVLMALADDELVVRKKHARNDEWNNITMRKEASSCSKVMPLTYQEHSLREKPSLGTMKHTKPEAQESLRGVLVDSSQSSESSVGVSFNTYGSTVHSTTDHNDFKHFKRGMRIQATKAR